MTGEKCKTCEIYKACEIYKKAQNQSLACCIWYMDNVVLGNKKVEDCTDYKKAKKK